MREERKPIEGQRPKTVGAERILFRREDKMPGLKSALSALTHLPASCRGFTAGRLRAALLAPVLGLAIAAAASPQAGAQDYPTQPIKMTVGYGPGATTDLLARIVAADMSKILGQPIPVENKPGANSAIAGRLIAQADADGYNLLFGASAMVSNIYGMKDPGYKMSDFEVVGGHTFSPFVLVVNSTTSGAKTLADLIAYGKANPGKLTYASLGPSSPANLASQRLQSLTGIGWSEVPFKGSADAVTALTAGTVDAYFAAPASVASVKERPDLFVVATSGKQRVSNFPEVPTFLELGYDVTDDFSYGVLVRTGTPEPILQKLRDAFAEAKRSPEARSKIEGAGLQIYEGTPEQYAADLERQAGAFEADFKKLGIEPQ
jgi:tripartite-type tricarboxylate transporter receptor subunit TctC